MSIPNYLADDSEIAGAITRVDESLQRLLKEKQLEPKPLLVCSGGTSTRCAADGHWTLDLRKCCKEIIFQPNENVVELGAGLTMKVLLGELLKYKRSFPTGLSGETGMGYILSGGISPLSRCQGLAIDQTLEINGIWGTGESFTFSKPNQSADLFEKKHWKALCGAAPFLAIITSLKLKTLPLQPIYFWKSKVTQKELSKLISDSEKWPSSASLQWSWGSEITAYAVMVNSNNSSKDSLSRLIKSVRAIDDEEIIPINGLHMLPNLISEVSNKSKISIRIHSEVLGILGPEWGDYCEDIIKSLSSLIKNRPHPNCTISSQQLGGFNEQNSLESFSFIDKNAMWKPWITASWEKNDVKGRVESIKWLKDVWETLEANCPGVHLAQMHQHLDWHQKEIKSAFGEWLPELQDLKSIYDPNGLLPAL